MIPAQNLNIGLDLALPHAFKFEYLFSFQVFLCGDLHAHAYIDMLYIYMLCYIC